MNKYLIFVFLTIACLSIYAKKNDVSKIDEKFYKAVGDADIELAKKYLSEGANINANVGSFGWTPLMKAVFGKSSKEEIEMFKFLLDNNADVNAKGEFNQTALHIAVSSETRIEEIKMLIEAGTEINAQTTAGATALINAAFWVNAEAVKYLIEKNADINIRNNNEETALMVAADDKNGSEVVELLINAGADVNVKNNKGKTPLSLAIKRKAKKTIELLQTAGAVE